MNNDNRVSFKHHPIKGVLLDIESDDWIKKCIGWVLIIQALGNLVSRIIISVFILNWVHIAVTWL